jgi:hypothetical protein
MSSTQSGPELGHSTTDLATYNSKVSSGINNITQNAETIQQQITTLASQLNDINLNLLPNLYKINTNLKAIYDQLTAENSKLVSTKNDIQKQIKTKIDSNPYSPGLKYHVAGGSTLNYDKNNTLYTGHSVQITGMSDLLGINVNVPVLKGGEISIIWEGFNKAPATTDSFQFILKTNVAGYLLFNNNPKIGFINGEANNRNVIVNKGNEIISPTDKFSLLKGQFYPIKIVIVKPWQVKNAQFKLSWKYIESTGESSNGKGIFFRNKE